MAATTVTMKNRSIKKAIWAEAGFSGLNAHFAYPKVTLLIK